MALGTSFGKPLKFTPPPTVSRYALYHDGELKTYNHLGSAKNAYRHLYNPQNVKILERVGDQWFILYDVPDGRLHTDEVPWVKKVDIYRYGRYESDFPRAIPMTRDEYADWRVKVELERRGITDASNS